MSEFSIRLEVPARRSSRKLLVVVADAQGVNIFRDWANLDEEKSRKKVAAAIAQETGEAPDDIQQRLLKALANIPRPAYRVERDLPREANNANTHTRPVAPAFSGTRKPKRELFPFH